MNLKKDDLKLNKNFLTSSFLFFITVYNFNLFSWKYLLFYENSYNLTNK